MKELWRLLSWYYCNSSLDQYLLYFFFKFAEISSSSSPLLLAGMTLSLYFIRRMAMLNFVSAVASVLFLHQRRIPNYSKEFGWILLQQCSLRSNAIVRQPYFRRLEWWQPSYEPVSDEIRTKPSSEAGNLKACKSSFDGDAYYGLDLVSSGVATFGMWFALDRWMRCTFPLLKSSHHLPYPFSSSFVILQHVLIPYHYPLV
jgi:hypothetical protein